MIALPAFLTGEVAKVIIRWAPWALLAPCFLLGQYVGKQQEKDAQRLRDLHAEVRLERDRGEAVDTGIVERAIAQANRDDQKRKVDDAVKQAPDSAPDAARIAAGCQRLRNAG